MFLVSVLPWLPTNQTPVSRNDSMHENARRALEKAKKLIGAADSDSLRYASLELRTAIEHLFYELMPLYEEELPSDIVREWRPVQIIDALVDCDPLVGQDTRICVFD